MGMLRMSTPKCILEISLANLYLQMRSANYWHNCNSASSNYSLCFRCVFQLFGFSFHCLVIHLCYTPLSILNLILEQRCHCMTMARMTTVRQVHFALVQWDVFGWRAASSIYRVPAMNSTTQPQPMGGQEALTILFCELRVLQLEWLLLSLSAWCFPLMIRDFLQVQRCLYNHTC